MAIGVAGIAAASVLLNMEGPRLPPIEADPSSGRYPVPHKDAYKLDRALTPEAVNLRWNNFYEFGSHKEIGSGSGAEDQTWDGFVRWLGGEAVRDRHR